MDAAKYTLRRAIKSNPHAIELERHEYESIRSAQRGIIALLDIEEKFDLVLANYVELERALLDLSLEKMVYQTFDLDFDGFRDDVQLVNRRLANLLSAARLYLDQISHDVKELYGKESRPAVAIKEEAARQYDSRLGYRAMEALRNYAQHRALPVHRLKYSATSETPKGEPVHHGRYGAVPSVLPDLLKDDPGFKGAIAEELAATGDRVPIMPLVRDYVDGLGEIQSVLRSVSAADVATWEQTLADTEERGRSIHPGEPIALVVVKEDAAGRWDEVEQVLRGPAKRRRALASRNGQLERLALRYVSGFVGRRDA